MQNFGFHYSFFFYPLSRLSAIQPSMHTSISISPDFASRVSNYIMVAIEADVTNGPTPEALTAEINALAAGMQGRMEVADINRRPNIAATRAAYKACGKDPNRYRPSQEQLHRRILRGLGLYSVDALVDLGNLLSLSTGCAVGVFDRDKIAGADVELGVGRAGEPYTGIGRGELNIEGLPVLRDAAGAFGSMTSDHERTKIEPGTQRVLITIHVMADELPAGDIAAEATRLLRSYAAATAIEHHIVAV